MSEIAQRINLNEKVDEQNDTNHIGAQKSLNSKHTSDESA